MEPVLDLILKRYKPDDMAHLFEHHIKSFNHFIDYTIPEIINEHDTFRQDKFIFKSKDGKEYVFSIRFTKIEFDKPKGPSGEIIYPSEAISQKLTYATQTYATYLFTVDRIDGTDKLTRMMESSDRIALQQIPIPVGSKLCNIHGLSKDDLLRVGEDPNDVKGYYIINGIEMCIVGQEKIVSNEMKVFRKKKEEREKTKRGLKDVYVVKGEISTRKISDYTVIYNVKLDYNPQTHNIFITIEPSMSNYPLPIKTVFNLLGVRDDRQIIEMIIGKRVTSLDKLTNVERIMFAMLDSAIKYTDDSKYKSFYDAMEAYFTTDDVLSDKLRLDSVGYQYVNFKARFLPNIENNFDKLLNLAAILNRYYKTIITKYGFINRDSFINKLVELDGPLFGRLFKQLVDQIFSKVRSKIIYGFSTYNDFKKRVEQDDKEIKTITQFINASRIDTNEYFISAFKQNSWKVNKRFAVKDISTPANAMETISMMYKQTELQKVVTVLKSTNKDKRIRDYDNASMGYLCPAATPEGDKVGVLKERALGTVFSISQPMEPIIKYCKQFKQFMPISEFTPDEPLMKVYLNSVLIGYVPYRNHSKYVISFVQHLIKGRRLGLIHKHTGIVREFDYYDRYGSEVRIYSTYGRLLRPLFIVEDGKLLFESKRVMNAIKRGDITRKSQLLYGKYACVEYISLEEAAKNCTIAQTIKTYHEKEPGFTIEYTHVEIDPNLTLGIAAASIPMIGLNPVTRISYACQHLKQSLSTFYNYYNVLNKNYTVYPAVHTPLVTTYFAKALGQDYNSGGTIINVAIYSNSWNQEDSLFIKHESILRGAFTIYNFPTRNREIKSDQTIKYFDIESTHNTASNTAVYSKIDPNTGIVPIGTIVEQGDCLMMIVETQKTRSGTDRYVDKSEFYKEKNPAVVQQIVKVKNARDDNVYRIQLKELRPTVIGDKFSSDFGQKGTVSMLEREENMLYDEDGCVVDCNFSLFAFPKRQTIGMFAAMGLYEIASILGLQLVIPNLSDFDAYQVADIMKRFGITNLGKKTVYHGVTGKKLNGLVFKTPLLIRKLKHMVDDKIQARGLDGRRDEATKQPTKGRKNAGGGRMSTTIVNCLKANSVYTSLIEILTQSDSEYAVYCNSCGREGYVDPNDSNNFICSSGCKNPTMFVTKIPYVLKILQNFLDPALIDCRFKCTALMPQDSDNTERAPETTIAFDF